MEVVIHDNDTGLTRNQQLQLAALRKLAFNRIAYPWRFYRPYRSPSRDYIEGHYGKDVALEMERRGLEFDREVQLPFHESPAKIRAFIGGNGSGKTYAGAAEVSWLATGEHPYREITNDRARVGRVACEAVALEQIMIPRLESMLPMHRVERHKSRHDHYKDWIVYDENGIDVICKFDLLTYGQDASVFESVELDWCWFDEPPPLSSWRATMWRLRAAPHPSIIVTMTPLSYAGWFVDEIINNELVDCDVFTPSCYDNPYNVPESIAFQISATSDQDERKAREWGEFKSFMGRVFKSFDRTYHVISEEDMIEALEATHPPVSCVLDPHDRKHPAVVWIATLPGDRLMVMDCLPEENWSDLKSFDKGPEGVVERMKNREQHYGYDVTHYRMDPRFGSGHKLNSNETVQDIYQRAGRTFQLAPVKDLETRHASIRDLLRVNESGSTRLYICERAKNVIKAFEYYTYKEAKNPEDPLSSRVEENWKDFIDCVGYEAVQLHGYEDQSPKPGLSDREKMRERNILRSLYA